MTNSPGALGSGLELCTRCARQNEPGSRFCSHCGASLLAAQSSAELTTTMTMEFGALELDPEKRSGLFGGYERGGVSELEVTRGPNAGSRFRLERDLVSIGRAQDSAIFLDDFSVSRRHAELTRAGGSFLVRDLGSLNGTYVERERVEEHLLADGEEIQIGRFRLVYSSPTSSVSAWQPAAGDAGSA
jgi:FHA domain/zinc-ribbon domain